MRDADVIVVGAGAAGLRAAGALRTEGVDVRVLEARARVGGRAWTVSHAATPAPIELGAEFVHGGAQRTERLAREAGALIVDVEGDQWRARDGRLHRQNDFWDAVADVMKRLDPDREPDRSFGDFLRERPGGRRLAGARTLARSFVQGFHAADIDEISERVLAGGGNPATDESAARHGRLTTGYALLMQQLARGCADVVRFGAVVKRIDWRDAAVAVAYHEAGDAAAVETLTARTAIITVPLPLLQARELWIEPEPASVRRALDDMNMGSVVRVSLVCRERFWEDDVIPAAADGASLDRLSFLHTPRSAFNIWWTSHPLRAPVLVGWSGGPPARELARTGNVEAAAITALAGALGLTRRRLEGMVEAVFTHDWDGDAYSRGAYSYVRAGGQRAPARLARPVKRTLFFAGEATAENDSGTVEGALVSADRAVQQVLRVLS